MSNRLTTAPFDPLHLKLFADRAAEVAVRDQIKAVDFDSFKDTGPGWVAYWNDDIVAAGGFVEVYGPKSIRASAWIFVLPMPRAAVVALFKEVRSRLRMAPYDRIEANVQIGFAPGHRLARMLGFRRETRVKALWFPDGQSASEYVITRPR